MDQVRLIDPQSIDSHTFENRLKLKPVVIAVSLAIGLSGGLTGCFHDDDDDNNNSGGGGAPGTNTINTSGGIGNSPGGSGGDVYFYIGGPDSLIEVLTSTSGAPTMSSIPISPDYGANPLVVSSSTALEILGAEPPMGTPYQVDDDCNVYISDGNTMLGDETPVTGIDVQGGTTLTLSIHTTPSAACVRTANDMNNDGTVTTDTDGGNLWLYADNYFGGGDVVTSGVAEGSSAGEIYVGTTGSHYSTGNFMAMGADSNSGPGGDGAGIDLYTNGLDLWTSGEMNSSGGNSTVAEGGNAGGYIELHLEDSSDGGSLLRAGETIARGGDGETGGGNGNDIWFEVDQEQGATQDINMYITASMHTEGGNGTGSPAAGGTGGYVYLYNEYVANGEIKLFGFNNITANGGSGSTDGGDGGYIEFEANDNFVHMMNEAIIESRGGDAANGNAGDGGGVEMLGGYDGELSNSGNINTSGGNATAGFGGDGGDIQLYRDGNNNAVSNTISNSGGLTADGGDGTDGGGNGGYIELYNYLDVPGTDTISNTGPISTTGGDATTGTAGYGGDVLLEQDSGSGDVSNSAPIDTSGGHSDSGDAGHAGEIEIEIEDGDGFVRNTATLTAVGGNSTDGNGGNGGGVEVEQESSDGLGGTNAAAGSGSSNSGTIFNNGGTGKTGGSGGEVNFYSPGLPSSNSADIHGYGGDGDVDGGAGGSLYYAYGEPFTNSGDVDLSGGNGSSGFGGAGGNVEMYSTGGTSTSNSGSLNVTGGTGPMGDGADGTISIDQP